MNQCACIRWFPSFPHLWCPWWGRSKWLIGLLTATVLGIIAIATTAAVAGAVLHQAVQTVQFVQEWHKDSDVL